MSRYVNQPIIDVDFLYPNRMSFDTPGSGLEGGRNGYGESISIETSGGGLVTGTYEECSVHEPEQHEYLNWVAARMNGSHRFMVVPILTDWIGAFPRTNGIPHAYVTVPHSDGSLHSDGAGYSQATVYGAVTEGAALNAGMLKIRLYGAERRLRWSDWFSIKHPVKGWRMYRYWDVLAVSEATETVDGVAVDVQDYSLAIAPALREAAVAGTRVEISRPRCLMKFPQGFTLPWEVSGFYEARPSMQFVEAF